MKRRMLFFTVPFLFLLFNITAVVLACSGCGGGCTWMDIENDLGENTIIVRGSGSMSEGYATIFVSEYIVGEPDYPYLRVYYFGEGENNASMMGYYSGSCGSGAKYPSSPDEAYYVMNRQQDGTYRINHIIGFPTDRPQFIDWNNGREAYSLTEAEFLERIHANPQPPLFIDMEFPYVPLSNPVLIETENRSLYLLPVDARSADDIVLIAENIQNMQIIDKFIGITTDEKLILHEALSGFEWVWDYPEGVDCAAIDCIKFSDNGVAMTLQVDADTVQLCELALIYPNTHYHREPTVEQHPCIREHSGAAFYNGMGVSFSVDSNYMAIWYEDEITIYGGLERLANLMNWGDNPVTITSIKLNISDDTVDINSLAGQGVWSKDNRWLAYSDAEGLWLWDVFTQDPQLFLATDHTGTIPTARFFSESGRYIAVSVGDEHFIMDRFSDLTFPDGVITPNDRMLIRRDTVNELPVPAETCNLLNGECSPFIETDGNTPFIRQAYWVDYGFRPYTWHTCFVLAESSSESRNSGVCWDVLPTRDYFISGAYQIDIDAEDVLDSPIRLLIPFGN